MIQIKNTDDNKPILSIFNDVDKKKVFEIPLEKLTNSNAIIDYDTKLKDNSILYTTAELDNGLILYFSDEEQVLEIFRGKEELTKSEEEKVHFRFEYSNSAIENKNKFNFLKSDLMKFLDETEIYEEEMIELLKEESEVHSREDNYSFSFSCKFKNGLVAMIGEAEVFFFPSESDFKKMKSGADETEYSILEDTIDLHNTVYTVKKKLEKIKKEYEKNKELSQKNSKRIKREFQKH